jgi:histidinol-phosphate aminotransferase/imidazoleglycerol-phosphate dehydratase/histidinol-phosphatase
MSAERILEKVRKSLLDMQGYKSARSMYQDDEGMIYLDANEIPYEPYVGADGLNRYIAQQPDKMTKNVASLYDISTRNLMISRGADEAIDILIRTFCEPKKDEIIICPPTFPMYAQSAMVNQVLVKEVPLKRNFQLDIKKISKKITKKTKIVFICSPNNPTANVMDKDDILSLAKGHPDIIIAVDETYNEFTGVGGLDEYLYEFENLMLFRTLSKSFASAGLRCGFAIGHADLIDLMKKVLAPYPISAPVAKEVNRILEPNNQARMKKIRSEILETRDWFCVELEKLSEVQKIYLSDCNFILAKVKDASKFYSKALESGIILRDQSSQKGLKNVIRISIGTRHEMETLLSVLNGEKVATTKNRMAKVTRNTNETKISVAVNLDQLSPVSISTGIGFYDHMLEQIAKHGGFSLQLECDGDLEIDPHHTIEDCAIALGQALTQALGDKRGIGRYGFSLPMDEANAQALLDLSGRYFLKFDGDFPAENVGDLPCDMIEHIFRSLAENMQMNCHISVEGENAHHMVEACFKAFGRALRQAIKFDGDKEALPSTKGML